LLTGRLFMPPVRCHRGLVCCRITGCERPAEDQLRERASDLAVRVQAVWTYCSMVKATSAWPMRWLRAFRSSWRYGVIWGHLALNAEVGQFQWAMRTEVLAMANEAFGIRVLDALDSPGHPAVRLHDGTHLL